MQDLNVFNVNDIAIYNDNNALRTGAMNVLMGNLQVLRAECYANFFSNRIVWLWNALPPELRLSELNENGKKGKVDVYNSDNSCIWVSVCRYINCRT